MPVFVAFRLTGAVGICLDLLRIHLGSGAGVPLDAATGQIAGSQWETLASRPEVVVTTGIASLALELAVACSAARFAGATVRDHLGLKPLNGRDLLVGAAAMAAVVFGWVRRRSGSTLLSVVFHGLDNLAACVEVAVAVARWWGAPRRPCADRFAPGVQACWAFAQS